MTNMSWKHQTTPTSVIAALVGDVSMLRIMRECFHHVRRIESFEVNLGIPRLKLADGLNQLVRLGLLRRIPDREVPARHEYVLTEQGAELSRTVRSLLLLLETTPYLDPDRRPLDSSRRTIFDGITVCPDCSEVLATEIKAGPASPS